MSCVYCSNYLNSELQKDNDYSSISIGNIKRYMRLSIESGGIYTRPRILIEQFNGQTCKMDEVGYYFPKYCPECGEKIVKEN